MQIARNFKASLSFLRSVLHPTQSWSGRFQSLMAFQSRPVQPKIQRRLRFEAKLNSMLRMGFIVKLRESAPVSVFLDSDIFGHVYAENLIFQMRLPSMIDRYVSGGLKLNKGTLCVQISLKQQNNNMLGYKMRIFFWSLCGLFQMKLPRTLS